MQVYSGKMGICIAFGLLVILGCGLDLGNKSFNTIYRAIELISKKRTKDLKKGVTS